MSTLEKWSQLINKVSLLPENSRFEFWVQIWGPRHAFLKLGHRYSSILNHVMHLVLKMN